MAGGDEYLGRWFELSLSVGPIARGQLYSEVREFLARGVEPGLAALILVKGGDALLKDGDFNGQADRVAQFILTPLVASSAGVEWMNANETWLRKLISNVRRSTKVGLRDAAGDRLKPLDDGSEKSSLQKLKQILG